jgi:hypothetical protein
VLADPVQPTRVGRTDVSIVALALCSARNHDVLLDILCDIRNDHIGFDIVGHHGVNADLSGGIHRNDYVLTRVGNDGVVTNHLIDGISLVQGVLNVKNRFRSATACDEYYERRRHQDHIPVHSAPQRDVDNLVMLGGQQEKINGLSELEELCCIS